MALTSYEHRVLSHDDDDDDVATCRRLLHTWRADRLKAGVLAGNVQWSDDPDLQNALSQYNGIAPGAKIAFKDLARNTEGSSIVRPSGARRRVTLTDATLRSLRPTFTTNTSASS
jgi:hypothetical protein